MLAAILSTDQSARKKLFELDSVNLALHKSDTRKIR